MKEYLLNAKMWYEKRFLREKVFLFFLCWIVIYVNFYFAFSKSLEKNKTQLETDTKALQGQVDVWNKQIEDLKQIANSPIYKEWLNQKVSLEKLQGQYKLLKDASSSKQWQDIIKMILQSQNNNILVQIKNFPETHYHLENEPTTSAKIYQQQLQVTILSGYFDTLAYLEHLEQILPNIRWDSLNYKVTQYPAAKVEMEFSIFYEKTE